MIPNYDLNESLKIETLMNMEEAWKSIKNLWYQHLPKLLVPLDVKQNIADYKLLEVDL